MAVFLVAHGAWSAGWAWVKMRSLLREAGHEMFTPSYTGLGERQHLARCDVNLSRHIEDLVHVIEFEGLHDVILVGHSFGGVVATGVADRARDRVKRLIYVDAFVPEDGQALVDLLSPQARDMMYEVCRASDGWRVPPLDMPPDTLEADRLWATPRRVAHPIAAFEEKLRLSGAPLPPRAYVYCRRIGKDDRFGPSAARARREGWPYVEIDSSHSPHITAPAAFGAILEQLADA